MIKISLKPPDKTNGQNNPKNEYRKQYMRNDSEK